MTKPTDPHPQQIPSRVSDIDWDRWVPVDRATLLFVVQQDRILLIHKKRGLGAGYLNGPGGRLDQGESPVDGAVREVREELRIVPADPRQMGQLQFQFLDGYSIHVWVFTSAEFEGVPTETDEAVPVWTPTDAIPYDKMWEDDRIWLPLLLNNRRFSGKFVFDRTLMLDHLLTEVDPTADNALAGFEKDSLGDLYHD